jgi:predicted DNA-binding transcriptional regulator AlpA
MKENSAEFTERILSTKEVAAMTNLHPVTLWRLARRPESGFPAPIKLTQRKNGWPLSQIVAWLAKRPSAIYGSHGAQAA